jgi:hypothetical protein
MSNPTEKQVIEIRDRIIIQRFWKRVMSIRNPQNNYIIELLGVVDFNIPCSLNWVRNVISSLCEWQTLIIDPNVWVHNFEYLIQRNNQIYYNEINDVAFNHY